MELGTRKSVVAYVSTLRNLSGAPDESGIPTTCPRDFAKKLHDSATRWESICRQAVALLSTYECEVDREDAREVLEEAEECARDIMVELDRFVSK
jgi:hypothetical protein